MNDSEALTPRQIRVIPYLLGAPSIEEGCKRARVSKTTVCQWLKEENFRKALKQRRDEMIGRALDSLKSNIAKATETLVKHLDSNKEAISIRAAENIIEFAQQAREHEELEGRIATLERKFEKIHEKPAR